MKLKTFNIEGYEYRVVYTEDGRCIDGLLIDTITGARIVIYPEHLEFFLSKLSEE